MILVAAAILFGVYHFYLKKMPTTDQGAASTQAISLTGVRSDLLQIAQAERGYIALNGRCILLTERDGYFYSVQCSGGGFTATARHAPASAGSPVRYPNLAIDATMLVHEIN